MSRTHIVHGANIAKKILYNVKQDICTRLNTEYVTRAPTVASIIVGSHVEARRDLERKARACAEVGINMKIIELNSKTNPHKLTAKIQELNMDDSIDSIAVQLPLPKGFNPLQISSQIDIRKDVDGFHPFNIGGVSMGFNTFTPNAMQAIVSLIDSEIGIAWLEGKNVVICGRSDHLCKPLQMWLQGNPTNHTSRPGANATVTLLHDMTNPEKVYNEIAEADMIITSTDTNSQWLTGDMIKPGCVVIDAGFNRCPVTKHVFGDVDFHSCNGVAGVLTQTPGGVGPLITAEFCKSVLRSSTNSCKKQGETGNDIRQFFNYN